MIDDANFEDKVLTIVKDYLKSSSFTQRQLTDTPTDNLQIVNKKYCDANSGGSSYGRMYLVGAQNATTNTATKVLLDTASFSSGVTADTANSKFTITTAGLYFLNGQVGYDAYVAGKNVVAEIYINGVQSVYSLGAGFNAGGLATQQVSDSVSLAVGDYVELYTFHNFGADAALEPGSIYTYLDIFAI